VFLQVAVQLVNEPVELHLGVPLSLQSLALSLSLSAKPQLLALGVIVSLPLGEESAQVLRPRARLRARMCRIRIGIKNRISLRSSST
jgi:hypothetical protein